MKIRIDVFDAKSIEDAMSAIDNLAESIEHMCEEAVHYMGDIAEIEISRNSPSGWSGDYKAANHRIDEKGRVYLWNDVSAHTPYDGKPYNPLGLRLSKNNGWVGEEYASAVEFGYNHGQWPLWKNSELSEGYGTYTRSANEVRKSALPLIRAEFSLD